MSKSINYTSENLPKGEQNWAEDTILYNKAATAAV
jgi:hypothetical protein